MGTLAHTDVRSYDAHSVLGLAGALDKVVADAWEGVDDRVGIPVVVDAGIGHGILVVDD